ncbi:urease accessory protein UreD [Pelagibius sp. 7325]|uniref:urease accessory protein UreD n=1 Tax=Pelagibius sp. 7325 TaxID=3131994 RepID=UPI0030ED2620
MNVTAPLALPAGSAPQRRRSTAALTFRQRGGRSFLARQMTPHPFHLTRPFYLPDDPAGMATLYLQSSSGGLYGDDDLHLDIALEEGAAAHVTTQASTVVHAARGGLTRQQVSLTCARDSLLEFLPDPLILFAGARLQTTLTAEIERGAILVLADSFLAHDPAASAAPFERFDNDIVVRRRGESLPLLIERLRLGGADWPPAANRHLGAHACHGSLCVAHDRAGDAIAAAMKQALADSGLDRAACYGGVNALGERGVVWARLLCRDGAALSKALKAVWQGARVALTGRLPSPRNK